MLVHASIAIAHLTAVVALVVHVGSSGGCTEKVKSVVRHSAVGPLIILSSFVLLDWCISNFESTENYENVLSQDLPLRHTLITVFATMIVSTLLNSVLGTAPLRLCVIFMLVTHVMVVVTYYQIHGRRGSGAVVWRTSYGSFFWPARINLWMHSSMCQVLSIGASPNAADVFVGPDRSNIPFDERMVLQRARDVVIMFIIGFMATAMPPPFLPRQMATGYRIFTLAGAAPFFVRIIQFLTMALPVCLHVPENQAATHRNRMAMRVLRQTIITTWYTFPVAWLVAAASLLTAEQESIVFDVTDFTAKIGMTIALQYGTMASNVWEERTRFAGQLAATKSMVRGFTLFTQCIGHDLRTPLQALVFSSLKAQSVVQAEIAELEARVEAIADENASEMLSPSYPPSSIAPSSIANESVNASPGGGGGGGVGGGGGAGGGGMSGGAGGGANPAAAVGESPKPHSSGLPASRKRNLADFGRGGSSGGVGGVGATPSDLALARCCSGSLASPATGGGGGGGCSSSEPPPTPLSEMPRGVAYAQHSSPADHASWMRLRELRNKLNEVGACAELLTCIVANIWDFEKLQAAEGDGGRQGGGTGTPDGRFATADELPCEIDVNDTILQLVEMLKSSPIYKSNVRLRTLCDDDVPIALWGSRTVLVRTLLNLVSNAMKFTDKGHVTIHTCLLSDGDGDSVTVRIDVIDTGRGMTEAEMDNMRQPYVQGRTPKGQVSGLGLGLPIVVAILEHAGGKFEMDSKYGTGTRCSFDLAFARKDPNGEEDKGNALSSRSHQKRDTSKSVLVVDDVAMIREGAAEMLRGFGHRVSTADDGESGLSLLKELSAASDLDVALVDIQMPGLCGDEVMVKYREWEAIHRPGHRLRVYACTGNATFSDVTAYMTAGFDGCVTKPIYPHVFRSLLSNNKARIQSALVPGCQHTHLPSSSGASSTSTTPDGGSGTNPCSPKIGSLTPTPLTSDVKHAQQPQSQSQHPATGIAKPSPVLMTGVSPIRSANAPAVAAAGGGGALPEWASVRRRSNEKRRGSAPEAGHHAGGGSAGGRGGGGDDSDQPSWSTHRRHHYIRSPSASASSLSFVGGATVGAASGMANDALAPSPASTQQPPRLPGIVSSPPPPRPPHVRPQPIGGMEILEEASQEGSKPSSKATSKDTSRHSSVLGSPINDGKSPGHKSNTPSFGKREQHFPSWLHGVEPTVSSEAIRQASLLPQEMLSARDIVTTLGYTPSQGTSSLTKFVPYARKQQSLMETAKLAKAWAPNTQSKDRTQSSIRSLAHAIKGAASMICALRLTEASKALQFAADALGGGEAASQAERDTASAAILVWEHELSELLALMDSEIAAGTVAQLLERTPMLAASSSSSFERTGKGVARMPSSSSGSSMLSVLKEAEKAQEREASSRASSESSHAKDKEE